MLPVPLDKSQKYEEDQRTDQVGQYRREQFKDQSNADSDRQESDDEANEGVVLRHTHQGRPPERF